MSRTLPLTLLRKSPFYLFRKRYFILELKHIVWIKLMTSWVLKCMRENIKSKKICLEGQRYLHQYNQSCMRSESGESGTVFLVRKYMEMFTNAGKPNLAGSWNCPPCQIHGETRAGIFKQSMGARNRVGIGLPYRPSTLHRLAEFIPWNRFLGSINV